MSGEESKGGISDEKIVDMRGGRGREYKGEGGGSA